MKLPNGQTAIVEIAKLRDYCLNLAHPRGRDKARVFSSALSMTSADAEELRLALVSAARDGTAKEGASDEYGTRYIIDFELRRLGRTAMVRSIWMVGVEKTSPRFLTCYVLTV
jgi:hypothetical protein